MADVIVYNMGGVEIINVVPLKQAIKMVYGMKAKIIEAVEGTFFGPYPFPKAIELVKFIYAKWKYAKKPAFSRRGVLRRDNFMCAYCNGEADTVDHIIPVSHGGRSTWMNSVASCFACNQKKRNRTPKEANMVLLFKAYEPFAGDLAIVV